MGHIPGAAEDERPVSARPRYPAGRMTTRLDPATARRWFATALTSLAAARSQLDNLNVFPVPDSDTGTNAVLTLSAAAREAQRLPDDAGLGELVAALAEGALWGARGNSGIILAQSLQALRRTFSGLESAGPVEVIRALDAVSNAASGALAHPVEGTIITVAREVAAATLRLPPGVGLAQVVDTALTASYRALEATTDQLEPLRGSGRVDAGGLVLVILIEALAAALDRPAPAHPDWYAAATAPAACAGLEGFEVMYVVHATHREATVLRLRLSRVGSSVVVVEGGAGRWHVHVHLDHPAQALAELEMSQVCVRRLDAPPRPVGIVAATTAPQLLEPLARAGAVAVLDPDDRTLARAVIDTGSQAVLVLPCSPAVSAAAAGAAGDPVVAADGIRVHLAPTSNDLAVLEALGVLGPAEGWGADQQLAAVTELVSATRVLTVPDCQGPRGEADLLAAAGDAIHGAPAVLSVLVGAAVGAHRAARRLTALVSARVPDVETYVVAGGQPAPDLVISAQ